MFPDVKATGLVWRKRARGRRAAYWQARTDLIVRGYRPKNIRLWIGKEPNEVEREWIIDRCLALHADQVFWAGGGVKGTATYDGTVKSLIRCYQTDPDSKFQKIRHYSKIFYVSLCKRIETDLGDMKVGDIKARNLLRWHESLVTPDPKAKKQTPKIAAAHSIMGMLRTLLGFGMTILEDGDCAKLSAILHKMRFEVAKSRTERLTFEHVVKIIAEAHNRGQHSIALAQAMQFELILRQKDVIGEWVPIDGPEKSDVHHRGLKWLRGVRWSEVDDKLWLRHITSKRQKLLEINLHEAPLVMEELKRFETLPSSGPIIVSELTGLPYHADEFRRQWRMIADAVGVPKSVRNMDSRAGAISEATDAGADLEHVRQAATHSDIAMTQRYSRGAVDKTANVQRARSEFRNKNSA